MVVCKKISKPTLKPVGTSLELARTLLHEYVRERDQDRKSSSLECAVELAMDYIVSPQNSYGEALTPNFMVFGGGAFGRQLGLAEVMG